LQRTHSGLIKADVPKKKEGKLWLAWGALGLVALATPIGLLASGTAWGEWGVAELKTMGLVPFRGIAETHRLVACADCRNYGSATHGRGHRLYPFGICRDYFNCIVFWLLGRWLSRKNTLKQEAPIKEESSD